MDNNDIPIEDNINNYQWGQDTGSTGEDINQDWSTMGGDTTGGGWDLPDEEPEIKELFIGDLFIILLENKDKPFISSVETIFEDERRVNLVDKDKKVFMFSYDDFNNLIPETDDYKALEIIRVKELDNISEYKKKKEEIYFEVETKGEFEKEYSETRKRDDLLTRLIHEYDCYDNDNKIESLYNIVQDIYGLIDGLDKEKEEILIQNHLVPIFSNDTFLYSEEESLKMIKESIEASEVAGEKTYSELIKQNTMGLNLFEYKEGNGYLTDNYIGDTLKECSLNSTCSGILGDYKYDERKTKKKLIVPQDKLDKQNRKYTELVEILPSDSLLLSGILEQKIDKHLFNYSYELLDNLSLFRKTLVDKAWSSLNLFYRNELSDLSVIDNLALVDSIKPDINDFISHNFNDKITDEKLKKILEKNLKTMSDIFNYIIKNEYGDKILNIDDIHNILFKYRIDYTKLDGITRKKIDSLLEDNTSEYIKEYKTKYKREIKQIKIRRKPLSDLKKIKLAQDYIFGLISEERKNELLKRFINLFTRSADKILEDPNFLYNKITNNKLLCKHYLYSVEIKNSNNVFDTLRSKFGLPPKEGSIYCRVCGEFICEEEYSSLEGFVDDKPIQSNEKLQSQEEEELKQKIEDKLDKKSDMVNYISIISSMIGSQLIDKDIYNILLCYDYLDHNVLADIRYKLTGVTDTDIHKKLSELLKGNKEKEKKEKDAAKIEKLKKKKSKIISEFQAWIKYTNKSLFLLSIISLYIQTAIPVYKLRRDIRFQIIEKDETLNDSTINYVTSKFKNMISKYKDDPFFESMIEIYNNKDMENVNEQLKRTISHCNSNQFPIFLERKYKYNQFMKSQEQIYFKQEWPTYKPLQKNKIVSLINKYLEKIKIDDKLRKNYGSPLIENISIIRPISELNELNISSKMDLPSVSILQNSSFRKLFRYTVSCYGIHESNTLVNLFFQNFLETSGEDREKIKTILSNNGWKTNTESFAPLSFKILREKVMPEILALYSRNNNYIDTCFNIEKNCNEYIHNSVNNYDLHQLNTYPKRIYKHILPIVYPKMSFKEINPEITARLFEKYRMNKTGDIVLKYDDSLYLNKYLINTIALNEQIELLEENKEITKNLDNFQKILEKQRTDNLLIYNPIIPPINKYSKEEYDKIKTISHTDSRFLKYLLNRNISLNDEEEQSKNKLIEKLPKSLTEPSQNPVEPDILMKLHIHLLEEYISKLSENKGVLTYDEYFQQIFSEYIKITNYNISQISEFLFENDHITSNQKERFEGIFTRSKKMKFNYENIQKILSSFINSAISYEDILFYLKDIQNIITHINKDPTLVTGLSNKIPKEWNVSDSIKNSFMNFIEREEGDINIKNNLLLHNRIFVKPRGDNYAGFNSYKTISKNYHVYLNGLFNYISDTFNDLEYLKSNKRSMFTDRYSIFYSKFLLINLLSKIMEYIRGLQTNQSDIINDAMLLFQSLEERNEEIIEESILICSQFLMDLITHLLSEHYDPTWLFMNKDKDSLINRLSKQKEREKQENIEKVHNPSPEERYLKKLKQETGQSNWWKESSESAEKYVNSDNYASHSESERMERLKEIFGQEIEFEDIVNKVNVDQFQKVGETEEEDGYLGAAEMDEDNEEFMDDFDEEQEMEFNE